MREATNLKADGKHQRRPDWEKMNGLLPAIVQHALTGRVLMQAYMNAEALEKTLQDGRLCFFSRSKGRLWTKGETSGHFLYLQDWSVDCDGDSLLFQVIPAGPTCHLGVESCFDTPWARSSSGNFLLQLEVVIASKAAAKCGSEAGQAQETASYTQSLLQAGIRRIAQKVGEEGVETALAAVAENDQAVLNEMADLFYHCLVLLQARGLCLEQVLEVLAQRRAFGQGVREKPSGQ